MSDETAAADAKRVEWYGWPPRSTANWIKLIVPTAIILIVLFSIVIWLALPTLILVEGTSGLSSDDEFEAALVAAIRRSTSHYELWYKSNIIIQSTLILTALLATVFASITTKENAEHIKKWSVLLTAVTAALASVQSTFHIRENMESFIKATTDLTLLETEYLAARAPFITEFKAKDAAKTPDTEKKLRELHLKYMPRYLNILTDRMHAWSNVGQQSLRLPTEPGKPSELTSNNAPP